MAKAPKPLMPNLAEVLAGAMPPLAPDEQELALALYRQLARGEPVAASALADELGGDQAAIADALERWPGIFRDEGGRVIGFWGLAIGEMPHRFSVDGRLLFTWCAWDALFIPELIGQTAEVESRSPTSGEVVRLIVDPDGVRELDPPTTVVSMRSPDENFDQQVISSFCHFVHFFSSYEEGHEWVSQHEGTFLLSVPEAYELGRLVNGARYDRLAASTRPEGPESR